jgi:hypothetical protein
MVTPVSSSPRVQFVTYGPVPKPAVLQEVLARAAPRSVIFFTGTNAEAELVASPKSAAAAKGNSNRSKALSSGPDRALDRKLAKGSWRLDRGRWKFIPACEAPPSRHHR